MTKSSEPQETIYFTPFISLSSQVKLKIYNIEECNLSMFTQMSEVVINVSGYRIKERCVRI